MRALGFDEGLARQDAALQRTQTQAATKMVKPELMAQGVTARENISDSAEDRGMFMSSERLRSIAGQQRNELYQLAQVDRAAADQLANIDMGLARELAGIGKQKVNAQQQHAAYQRAQAEQDALASAAMSPMQLVVLGGQTQQPYSPTPSFPAARREPTRRTGAG